MKLCREFYLRSGVEVARDLIGKVLVCRRPEGVTRGIIVETEAYMGHLDAAAHSYKAPSTGRTAIQYGPGGYAYVYTIYGLHTCMNVVANRPGCPEAVLIRALEPVGGIPLMQQRRKSQSLTALCSGPGKLAQAMGITMAQYGADLCGEELYLEEDDGPAPEILETKRINVDYAGEAADYPWRFLQKGSRFVSVPPRK
ncbi:MAG: DNA-3-methyladenine glycosylase [Eubacteriales bacterium]|nr:DNA-3-methyladenine glycosylase [Eubacteriales bacterium]